MSEFVYNFEFVYNPWPYALHDFWCQVAIAMLVARTPKVPQIPASQVVRLYCIKRYCAVSPRGLYWDYPSRNDAREGVETTEWWFLDFEYFWAQVAITSLLGWISEFSNPLLHDWWPHWGFEP
jgi:hypothetical protein